MRFLFLILLLSPVAFAAPDLEQLEKKVTQEMNNVTAQGYDYRQILSKSRGQMNSDWFQRADLANRRLQESYDELALAELENLMGEAEAVLKQVMVDPASSFKERGAADELLLQAKKYRELIPLYGTSKDLARKKAYTDFFKGFRALNESLLDKPLGVRLREKIRAILAALNSFSEPLKELPAMLKTIYFSKDRKPLVIGNILDFAAAYKRGNGLQVTVTGPDGGPKPAIPANPRDGKVVNVYAPSHRLPMNDLAIMSEIAPRDSLVFMAPKNFLPGPLAGQLAGKPGLLAVTAKKGGPKPKPGELSASIKEALKQLKSSGTRNIYIYPEGGVPAGLMENQPNKENFGKSLIPALREAGYEVNVIPVTHADAARFMNQNIGSKELHAAVHEPIPDHVLELWQRQDPEFLNRYLRSLYMANIENDSEHLMGIVRPKELRKQLNQYLGSCSEHYANIGK